MVRSDENQPMLAVFTSAIALHDLSVDKTSVKGVDVVVNDTQVPSVSVQTQKTQVPNVDLVVEGTAVPSVDFQTQRVQVPRVDLRVAEQPNVDV